MNYDLFTDPELIRTLQFIVEVLGTFTFAISGIRQAAGRGFDWFGGFVCGFVVAIGGGTLRDIMLGVTPFWMIQPIYIICTLAAFGFVIVFSRYLKRLDNAWFVFDTLGLALYTIAGLQKTLAMGYPFWVAIIMGCITGSAGGVLRDIFIGIVPVLFRKEFYAMACVIGGMVYWLMTWLGVHAAIVVATVFVIICLIRFLALRYHLSLPTLRKEDGK